jgi:hypothetical protein
MILGSVILGSFAGLMAFFVALAAGNSFLTSIAVYSSVGMLCLMACILWSVVVPHLRSGRLDMHHGAQRPSET